MYCFVFRWFIITKKCRALLHQLDMKNVHVQVTLDMTDIYLSLPHLYVCKKYFYSNYLNKYYSPPLSVFQEKLRKVALLSCSQQNRLSRSNMKQRCSSIDSIPSHISQRRLIFRAINQIQSVLKNKFDDQILIINIIDPNYFATYIKIISCLK